MRSGFKVFMSFSLMQAYGPRGSTTRKRHSQEHTPCLQIHAINVKVSDPHAIRSLVEADDCFEVAIHTCHASQRWHPNTGIRD